MYAKKLDEQLTKSKLCVTQNIQEREKHLRFQTELETKFSFFKSSNTQNQIINQRKKEHEHGSSYKKINI